MSWRRQPLMPPGGLSKAMKSSYAKGDIENQDYV